eukprot:2849122-Pleurochrysis_carterae.AAC.1
MQVRDNPEEPASGYVLTATCRKITRPRSITLQNEKAEDVCAERVQAVLAGKSGRSAPLPCAFLMGQFHLPPAAHQQGAYIAYRRCKVPAEHIWNCADPMYDKPPVPCELRAGHMYEFDALEPVVRLGNDGYLRSMECSATPTDKLYKGQLLA